MGSVKDLIKDDSHAGKLYRPPTFNMFGLGAWQVKGTFSVGDLKEQIPETTIKHKPEALAMMTGAFFEWLRAKYPTIPTCYVGVMGRNGDVTTTDRLLDRGELSSIVVMELAHVPKTFSNGDLKKYRTALASGELQCGVADVESIFRKGLPLGSSVFTRIVKTAGIDADSLATYQETVAALDMARNLYKDGNGGKLPELDNILKEAGLTSIPNPGYLLHGLTYHTTTKFEDAGDRDISVHEAQKLSGLNEVGYGAWAQIMFPLLATAQIRFCRERDILNMDGKAECVAYKGNPVVTDFACTIDENRLMILTNADGTQWAIPSNKEIQRAVFRQAGVYNAISEAKERAAKDGDINKWKNYFPQVVQDRHIDLMGVAEHSCELMSYAVAEVANRLLGRKVFDAKPLESWVHEFMPYASKLER